MKKIITWATWLCVILIGAITFGAIALHHGETINAIWLVIASVLVLTISYRYYSLFIANRVLSLNPNTITPAVRFNDGLDYVPTNRYILFGHHFAAIAGAGPLIGPVLAAQMGYLPGMLWILIGVVIAGAVQDFIILFISMRNDGRSLGELVKNELGFIPGILALFSTFMIMIIILSALALIVVKALINSPWSLFTVAATIPIGILMGIYLRYIRPGKIGEISIVGFILLIAAVVAGKYVAFHPTLGPLFTFEGKPLILMLMGYGFCASVLPVWLLLSPRGYLSTYLKIGTLIALALAILLVAPEIKMPDFTRYIDGTGPVWAGKLFPFLFITIACGAVSGFHSLISSGTTPKMLANETDARLVGYGGMLMEGFVAMMALIAASCLEPGVYFAINSPAIFIGNSVESAAQTISHWGFTLTPNMLTETASTIGETTILSRIGGAPTLAIGIAGIFSQLFTNQAMLAFWYHFAIVFEALFILTAVDSGTRAGRFMLQDLMGTFVPALKKTESWIGNILATSICVGAWGYFLYQGVTDPFGGINTLWPLFGISNQMLAGIALILCTVVLFKMKRERYAWVTLIPTAWLIVCTVTAGWQKVFSDNPRIGFLAHASNFQAAEKAGKILPPATDFQQMMQIIFNDYVNATLTLIFMFVVVCVLCFGIISCWRAFKNKQITFEMHSRPSTEHGINNCC